MQQFFQFIILTFIYSSTCFGRFPAHHQELNDCSGSLWFYLRIVVTVVLCSWSSLPAGPTTGGKTPETCSAVNKRQDNKLENCCIWLVIYLNCIYERVGNVVSMETRSFHISTRTTQL
jgi:hypothetical protein